MDQVFTGRQQILNLTLDQYGCGKVINFDVRTQWLVIFLTGGIRQQILDLGLSYYDNATLLILIKNMICEVRNFNRLAEFEVNQISMD